MSLQKLIINYSEYNSWANSKFVMWLQTIEETLLYKQIPSSFDSIDNTVQHILRVQKFWTEFICQRDVSKFDWSVKINQAGTNLVELKKQSETMKTAFVSFNENELELELTLIMPWARNKLSRYEYILHVINHSTYHRGQIITIARNLGISGNIPSTDYNFFNCQVKSR